MNYKTIKSMSMLSVKNIYALSFVCVTHLGCSSHYRCRMEREGTVSGQSSHDVPDMFGVLGAHGGDMGAVNLNEKVNKFLETGKFKKGSSVTDGEITSVIQKLDRPENIFSVHLLNKEYKQFLNEYGSISGKGFRIYGPNRSITIPQEKIDYMASIQLGFENRCKINEMKEKKEKLCWLVAEVDQGDQYYINLSTSVNKDYIYSMSRDGRSKIFAENFLDFLDKFFESYDRKDREKSYEEEFYK